MELKRQKLDKLVGEETAIPVGTLVENSVIGDNVVVNYPTSIKNSLIFPGSHVTHRDHNDYVIIHGENTIFCNGGAS